MGRSLPTEADVGPARNDRFVGVFYWLWHGYVRTSPIRDVSVELALHPDQPQFTYQDWFWAEPEAGYYHASDPWVARRNLQMLADAGVDFIFFDFTNGPIGKESLDAFLIVAEQMRVSGIPVPRFVFFLNSDGSKTLDWLYANVYQPGKYKDLWFEWQGKPLLMADAAFASSPEIGSFFTFRHTWAFQSEQHDEWRFIDDYPQRPSWHSSPDAPEQICVSKSMGAPLVPVGSVNNKGSSYHDGKAPEYDAHWLSTDTAKGLFFDEQWRRALTIDPPIVLVSGWNELTAGAWNADAGMAGNYTFMGKPLQLGGWFFVDEFNAEFNRDLEPMKSGYTDDYYYQLVANIRKYKGIEPAEPVSKALTVAIDGAFQEWHQVLPLYRDPPGDTAHRDFRNVDASAQLTNTTGRNDIIEARTAHDSKSLYFYAKTAEALSPASDPNWMLLFIDSDRNPTTGWQGYDFMIGQGDASAGHTPVQRWQGDHFEAAFSASTALRGQELELAVDKAALGLGDAPSFDFHWADNVQKVAEMSDFFLNGDSAPDRRFNYRYDGLTAIGTGGGSTAGTGGGGGSGSGSGSGGSTGASSAAGRGGNVDAASGGAAGTRADGGAASSSSPPAASDCACSVPGKRSAPGRAIAWFALAAVSSMLNRRRSRRAR